MDTPTEFRLRRRRTARFALPCILIGFLGFSGVGAFARNADWSGLAAVTFFAIALCGGILCIVIYLCPACDKLLTEDPETSDGGIVWNLSRCPHFGIKLKRGN